MISPETKKISVRKRLCIIISWCVITFVLFFAAMLAALQTGLADQWVSQYARQTIYDTMRDHDFGFEFDQAALRLAKKGLISVQATGIHLNTDAEQANTFGLKIGEINLNINPLKLLVGRADVSNIGVSDVHIVAKNNDTKLSPIKIADIDELINSSFSAISQLADNDTIADLREIEFENINISHPAMQSLGNFVIENADIRQNEGGVFSLNADALLGEDEFQIKSELMLAKTTTPARISIEMIGLDIDHETNQELKRRSGLKTTLSVAFEAKQGAEQDGELSSPYAALNIGIKGGHIMMGGQTAELIEGDLNFELDADKQSIEITPSYIEFAQSRFPISGGIIDPKTLNQPQSKGYIYDILINDAVSSPKDSPAEPLVFSLKAFGSFNPETKILTGDEIIITAGQDYMVANSVARFGDGSPELDLSVKAPSFKIDALKQLWPYWLGPGTRKWAIENIYGQNIENMVGWLHIDAGLFSSPIRPIRHSPDNFQIDFDFINTRVNVAGEVPPIRDGFGKVSMRGERLDITLDSGKSYFPSGRTVSLQTSQLSIENTNNVPLMLDVQMAMQSEASAAAELIGFEPIDVLDDVGFAIDDFSGEVNANVNARFGPIQSQNPPAPTWQARLDLKGVNLAKEIEGQLFQNINGILDVTPERAKIDAEAITDSIAVKVEAVEPIGEAKIAKTLKVTGTLNAKQRQSLDLGLEDIVFGPTDIKLSRKNDDAEDISIDLTKARVKIPGIGWEKSAGIAAKSEFILVRDGNNTGLQNFTFSGKGFSVSGRMSFDDKGLTYARFDRVKLSPKDDYTLIADRQGNTYKIELNGNAFDIRPLIADFKREGDKTQRKISGPAYDINANVSTVIGFRNETMSNVKMRYLERDNIAQLAQFSGQTRRGGKLTGWSKLENGTEVISVSSNDAGSVWRFVDVYDYIQSGNMEMKFTRKGEGARQGTIRISNFDVIGDERLKRVVSARAGEREKSLNDVLKGRIDVSKARFDYTEMSVSSQNRNFIIKDGIIRGPQIGAAFSGVLFDEQDQTNMTGTFMPAYALNRLLTDIPIIGRFLGNGRDRAVLGITFRIQGDYDDPDIDVNPLSAVAPGVFRSIFEFGR